MGTAIFNLVMGGIAIVAALSGYVLPFTGSSTALLVVGLAIAALGAYQLFQLRR